MSSSKQLNYVSLINVDEIDRKRLRNVKRSHCGNLTIVIHKTSMSIGNSEKVKASNCLLCEVFQVICQYCQYSLRALSVNVYKTIYFLTGQTLAKK